MKTKTNINRAAKMSLITLAVFFLSAVSPAQDSFVKDSNVDRDHTAAFDFATAAAFDRLDALNGAIEESIRFTTPSVNEDVEAYELQAATERLEVLNLEAQESARYQASAVNEEAEAYELAAAEERLEDMSLAVEASIKFQAPVTVDNEFGPEKMEYVNNGIFTIPVAALAMDLVLVR
jgi:hypothetical protein